MNWDRCVRQFRYSMKSAVLGWACCIITILVFGCPVFGEEILDMGASFAGTRVETITSRLKVEISSRDHFDASPLLQTIGDEDSIEEAFQKIDRIRLKQCPAKELKLRIDKLDTTRAGVGDGATVFIDLATKIAWFNSSHVKGNAWIAKNVQSGAACCVVKVTRGKYDFYYENPNTSWRYGGSRAASKVWAATTYGSDLLRGFKGVATGTGTNRSDIYMYFYYIAYIAH